MYALDRTTGYKDCLVKKQLRKLKMENFNRDSGFTLG
jgi:hypothetical protein